MAGRRLPWAGFAVLAGIAAPPLPAGAVTLPDRVTVSEDRIEASLTGQPGDPARGRAVVVDRAVSACLLCHSGPFPEVRFQGTLAPTLAGAGARLDAAQLRLRLVDSTRINPDSIMPSYYRLDGLNRVAAAWAGKPVLTGQQLEDVVAYLMTLRDPG